ncbi:MAG: dUTP diphosphatase [Alphaproteobacteria bacterium]|nr:dUTP diphosphatase [Alphaproteobacteria bacterium]
MAVSLQRKLSAVPEQNRELKNQALQNQALSIPIKLFPHAKGLDLPSFASEHAAGMDLMAAIDAPVTIKSHEFLMIPTGMAIALPHGYECQVRPRSGLAAKHGITVLNAPGTVDADYRGEIKVILINHSSADFVIERGMRIAQMVVARYTRLDWNEVAELDDTARGCGGFGSTGIAAK